MQSATGFVLGTEPLSQEVENAGKGVPKYKSFCGESQHIGKACAPPRTR